MSIRIQRAVLFGTEGEEGRGEGGVFLKVAEWKAASVAVAKGVTRGMVRGVRVSRFRISI